MMLVGGFALWRGYLDAWSDIAFVGYWFIAFVCTLGYYALRRLVDKGGKPKNEQRNSDAP